MERALSRLTPLIAAAALVLALGAAMAGAAAPDKTPPRIVAATMVDANRNARADRVRLTYSEPVKHARQAGGKFPFTVSGYRIRSVEAASGRLVVVVLAERAAADPAAAPTIRYVRTRTKPVLDRAGNQALGQTFTKTKAHRNAPPPPPPTTPPPGGRDRDGDGTPDAEDCAPDDRTIHPKAEDRPDPRFVDSNCDGIDGTEAQAVFVSPLGNDTNPGTKAAPKRQIAAAVAAAAGKGRYVLVAAGTYGRVEAASGVGIYGGYLPERWSVRSAAVVTQIVGSPEGLLADGAKNVELQLLSIRGEAPGTPAASAYGLRAIGGAELRLVQTRVAGGRGAAGRTGTAGASGRPGADGQQGARGACDHNVKAPGGARGTSPVGRDGGKGGDGRYESRGQDGEKGVVGTPGGTGGKAGISGSHGTPGAPGLPGRVGPHSPPATSSAARATTTWRGMDGVDGSYGGPGMGGGGGGAGGGQDDLTSINGTGNAGGGGGGGGEGGRGGTGGQAGGGSFGIYAHGATIRVEGGSIEADAGGAGGSGGAGGLGGRGGRGGPGHGYCRNELGTGAAGGNGGAGGRGSGGRGGAGGPSIGIFKLAGATVTVSGASMKVGAPGAGGATGEDGTFAERSADGIAQLVYP